MPRGDKPTTVAPALKDGWIYEDQLPRDISKAQYDWWYKESLVLDGVRMGPPIPTTPYPASEAQLEPCRCTHLETEHVLRYCMVPNCDCCQYRGMVTVSVNQIDPVGDFVERVWKLTSDRDGWSRITLRGIAEAFARHFRTLPPAPSSDAREADRENISCAFCGDSGFDLIGLKGHLLRDCEHFDQTERTWRP